jgi:hypothetical protein
MAGDSMPPEENDQGSDPLVNLKAELNRKLTNSEEKIAQFQKTQDALLAKLNEMSAPKAAPAQKESLSDLIYSDPDRYAAIITSQAVEAATSHISKQQMQQAKTQGVLQALQNEFPELSDSGHELTQKAVEVYNSLPDDERSSSLAYKVAVKQAALDLGYKPKSKRPAEEEPSIGSSGGYKTRKSTKVDAATEQLAAMFGINTSDPKVKERLVKASNREWNKYRNPKE